MTLQNNNINNLNNKNLIKIKILFNKEKVWDNNFMKILIDCLENILIIFLIINKNGLII
jgi:hypothetical protein